MVWQEWNTLYVYQISLWSETPSCSIFNILPSSEPPCWACLRTCHVRDKMPTVCLRCWLLFAGWLEGIKISTIYLNKKMMYSFFFQQGKLKKEPAFSKTFLIRIIHVYLSNHKQMKAVCSIETQMSDVTQTLKTTIRLTHPPPYLLLFSSPHWQQWLLMEEKEGLRHTLYYPGFDPWPPLQGFLGS